MDKRNPMSEKPLFLRIGEAATMCGVSRSQIYALIAKKELPAIKFGTALRVPVAALEQKVAEALNFGSAE
jgi:excisionase family DNA binding protein